jgi:hypothetical protein
MTHFTGSFRVLHNGIVVRKITQQGDAENELKFKENTERYERVKYNTVQDYTFERVTCMRLDFIN